MDLTPARILKATHQLPIFALAGAMMWGLLGGWVGTLVMDLVLMGSLAAVGLPSLTCFTLVGNTVASFFSILGRETAGSIPLGIATHYMIGPAVGAIFGLIVARMRLQQDVSIKKITIWAILFIEILSQPILASAPILLPMETTEILMWFGGSLVMHFIMGTVLGMVMGYGLRKLNYPVTSRPIQSSLRSEYNASVSHWLF